MKNRYIQPIVFSVIGLLLFAIMITFTFLLVGAHIKTHPNKLPDQPTPSVDSSDTESSPTIQSSPVAPSSPIPEDNSPSKVPSTAPMPSDPIEEDKPWILKESEDQGISYQDRLTFLGDSTTYGLLDRALLTNGKDSKQVWFGVSGHTITFKFHETIKITDTYDYGTPNLEAGLTIKDMAKAKKPEILVITLGVTGGVSYFSHNMNEDTFSALYAKLIDDILEVSPNTKIICNSIYPVCKVVDKSVDEDITNHNIKKANGWIENLVENYYGKGKNVYYLDSYSALLDEEGYLPADYTNGDGLHLSDNALKTVLELLRTHPIPSSK